MIAFISSWAQTIIFAVIIGVIIQMLIPEGKNKKYIKVVIGIYVLFSIISPVVGKNIELDLGKYNIDMKANTNETEESTKESINEMYITNLKQDIINKLKNRGYGCEKVELEAGSNYEIKTVLINGIYEIKEEKVETVNKIIINDIEIGKEEKIKNQVVKGIATSEEKKLKEYLSETYDVKENNIRIE